jgi:hypothetical protein
MHIFAICNIAITYYIKQSYTAIPYRIWIGPDNIIAIIVEEYFQQINNNF